MGIGMFAAMLAWWTGQAIG